MAGRIDIAAASRADVRAMAAAIAHNHDGVAAVLFYGSGLRSTEPDAILDLYVLTDTPQAFFRAFLPALACRLLPPNVLFFPSNGAGNAGFKVAVISCTAFASRLTPFARDTTLWARFCQPVELAYARDAAAERWVCETLAAAGKAAAHWAVRLGPQEGNARDYWTALFRHTYAAELRVEGGGRATTLFDYAPAHYAAFLPADGLVAGEGRYRRMLAPLALRRAKAAWARRRVAGKVLNALRLIKALFTFADGVDYILWKLERHSGQRVILTPWQKRHPLLAAPFVLTKLVRRGIVR